jgi:hypothetical protein
MRLFVDLKKYPLVLRIGLRIVPFVPVIGLMILLISGEGRHFSAKEVHSRWIVTGVLVSGVVFSVCMMFIRAFRNRLNRVNKLIIAVLGVLTSAAWAFSYMAADPASESLIQIAMAWKICLALFAALMAVVSFFVGACIVDAKSMGAVGGPGARVREGR